MCFCVCVCVCLEGKGRSKGILVPSGGALGIHKYRSKKTWGSPSSGPHNYKKNPSLMTTLATFGKRSSRLVMIP